MKRLITLSLMAIMIISLLGCSQDKIQLIQGNWVAEFADQKVQTEEELSHYNYLQISPSEIKLMNFTNRIQDKATLRTFDEKSEFMNYEWEGDKQIIINDNRYEIVLKKSNMVIKNENIEIHYKKDK
ncbi:hypothetical protein [Fontibacillus sp. BL9]|uniref:hypothetical protein n=1 Tax=Fontibacillus sp. BL9 TaxID=3389971 RepID=UPI0039787596